MSWSLMTGNQSIRIITDQECGYPEGDHPAPIAGSWKMMDAVAGTITSSNGTEQGVCHGRPTVFAAIGGNHIGDRLGQSFPRTALCRLPLPLLLSLEGHIER